MKIAAAQIHPLKGDITNNLEKHIQFVEKAVEQEVDCIIFPELSLTAYEPAIAQQLATDYLDSKFDSLQQWSNTHHITIGAGMPVWEHQFLYIGMIVFQPFQNRQVYYKQLLHKDELPYFQSGNKPLVISVKNINIAPAICYESLQEAHVAGVSKMKAQVYFASVAKAAGGIHKAFVHYPYIAKKYKLPVIMANNIGPCDNFVGAGQSGVWNDNGQLLAQLDDQQEGLVIFDIEKQEAYTLENDPAEKI